MKILFSLFYVFLSLQLSARTYVFTDKEGRELEAEVLQVNQDSVLIRRTSDFRQFVMPFNLITEKDRQAMKNWGRPDMEQKEPDQRVKPGKSIQVEFPELKPDRRGNPAVMNIRIPENYNPAQPVPLFIFMGGGDGGNRASNAGLVDQNRFVLAGLPYPKGANNPNQSNMVGDFDEVWENYHRPMLQKLFEMVPNIDRRLCILGGFSNGAHCIAGVLQTQKDGGYPEFMNCFILVDGGNGDRSLKGPEQGGFLFATWGETSPNAGRTEDAAKKAKNMQVQTYEMKASGHKFNEAGKAATKKWLNEVVIPATLNP